MKLHTAAAAALLLAAAAASEEEHCTALGERCAGADGRSFFDWLDCCGAPPAVVCLPHPRAAEDPEQHWGRFCQEAGRVLPAKTYGDLVVAERGEVVVSLQVVRKESAHTFEGGDGGGGGGGGGGLVDGRAPKATYPATEKKTLLPDRYTADASAHVVDGKVFVWCSHDLPVTTTALDETQYMMRDYALLGFSKDMGTVEDYGDVLPIESVPWADRMLWAPDAVCKDGMGCFLYFPAQDKDGVFRIGVAVSETVYGPYKAEPKPIPGSFSVDPAVFTDNDGESYMVFGGDWGGQLQGWASGTYDKKLPRPTSGPALKPRVAKMSRDMKSFAGGVHEMAVLDLDGNELQANDLDRRFFEGAWMHKLGMIYYLSYSTGETHKLVYATSGSPTGPWTFQGELMSPPAGWTTHHSIVKATDGKWYLFYHDSQQSGKDNLRNVKMQELKMDGDKILPVSPY